ncbi:MAG TPA: M20/M25/M40 family metallo-hydrolase [Pyrinomonadaceae bacterium]|nr:M20/M25/M40 family metallo-hydrolase [Pyrinomonadaceae bacterium]
MNLKRFTTFIALLVFVTTAVAQELEPSAAKIQQHVTYLASDELDGRRTGTPGANEAAKYIAREFERLGLRPAPATDSRKINVMSARYLQTFPYIGSVELGKNNVLSVRGSETLNFRAGEDWMPLGISPNQKLDLTEVVSAGYGITANDLNYNDYKGTYSKNQVAVIQKGTPDGDNPHGRFTTAGQLRFKIAAAQSAGVGALLIISSEDDLKNDALARLSYDNAGLAGIPVAVISKQAAEKLANAKQVTLKTDVVRADVPAHNVVGVIEGSDPVLKDETIVIGAHYDHLGRGGEGSLAPRSGEIHHGADDNASGTAGVLELARIFSTHQPKLKRTLVFIAFSGEEEGLLGSNYYVNHPLVPLDKTVAMINMDMIGRMKDRKLVIGGVGTAKEWRQLITQANMSQKTVITANSDAPAPRGVPIVVSANGRPIMTTDPNGAFVLTMNEDGYGPSDHSSFYSKQIPVLFFWTGTHNDYHKPSDTFEKINYNDEVRILSLVARIVRDVDSADPRLTFTTAKSDPPRGGGFRVYLGTIPNYADSNDGLLIDGVRDDSPAAKAGLKAGDKIVKIGNREVKNVYDYTYALGEMKAGQEYVIEVMRGSEKLTLKITPEARK